MAVEEVIVESGRVATSFLAGVLTILFGIDDSDLFNDSVLELVEANDSVEADASGDHVHNFVPVFGSVLSGDPEKRGWYLRCTICGAVLPMAAT